jgi:aminoglycoside phosphotransferase
MHYNHVIVQAGGKGTRLEHYTWNKPKCLVPVAGKPMLYHLFDVFPEAEFTIIADYKSDVLRNYMAAVPPRVKYRIVEAGGHGTASGIAKALAELPDDNTPFWLLWSDLRIMRRPDVLHGDVLLGITSALPCRWSYDPDHGLLEAASHEAGVPGVFHFTSRRYLDGLPASGEFVRWLSQQELPLTPIVFNELAEYGTLNALHEAWDAESNARFFNDVKIGPTEVIKSAADPRFQHLIDREIRWYKHVAKFNFPNVARLISTEPMTLARIDGDHPYALPRFHRGKVKILENIISALNLLHSYEQTPADDSECHEVYLAKTLQRLGVVDKLLPDVRTRESYRINGRLCRNILHPRHHEQFVAMVSELKPSHFNLIHGDPTFSNTLVDRDGAAVFIDPRGYFGKHELYGDPDYDFAKLYYSVVGSYDVFNRRRFMLDVNADGAAVDIPNSAWRHLAGLFHDHFPPQRLQRIRLIHALIWLSLAGYAENDHDQMVGAFYNGLWWLEMAQS